MRLPFISLLFILSALGIATAAESTSMTQQYQVIQVQQGEIKFPISAADRRILIDDGYTIAEKQHDVSCQADVKAVALDERQFPGSRRLNDLILKQAQAAACAKEFREAKFIPESIVLENNLISILFYRLQYPAGGNGSCHGGWQTVTADVRGGYVYMLSDLLDDKQLSAFYVYMSEKLSQLGEPDSRPSTKSIDLIIEELKNNPDKFGFYLQQGKLFLEVNSFLLSCAEGNHFPVEIPLQFIRKSVLTSPFINILAEAAKVP